MANTIVYKDASQPVEARVADLLGRMTIAEKIGAKVVTHARYVIFQMAEVAVPKQLFRAILARTRRLRPPETVPG